jgi:glycosyltransferase involved in cell wall biosynthesis
MKVLWFSPIPLPSVCKEMGLQPFFGGWWIWSLLQGLAGRSDVELAVAWASRSCAARRSFAADGIRYYILPEPGRFARGSGCWRRIDDESAYIVRFGRHRRALAESVSVVEDFGPDLVHVFGSEHYHGLVASRIRPPLVLWIQGILDVYRHHFFGSMCCGERLAQPRMLCSYWRMVVNAAREREIFRRCHFFVGRTKWDAAHQVRLQPKGHYYAIQDCIRPEFLAAPLWQRRQARDHVVYTTTSASLLKGTDVLVRAIALMRRSFPNVRLRIAGTMTAPDPVALRLRRLVSDLGLSTQVEFLGHLDGPQIIRELQQAQVFVLPSFIENNPNSLAEAQIVGTPVVAAYAGGVPDMVTDGETGLLFQAGDSATLAHEVARVLADDSLATRLGSQASRVARARHSPITIVNDLLKAYENILESRLPYQS